MADIKKIFEQMNIDKKIGQLVQYNAGVVMDSSADITGPRLQSGLSDEQISRIVDGFNL